MSGRGLKGSSPGGAGAALWRFADLAAALFAIEPEGFGGLRLRAGHGPVRDRFEALLKARLGDNRSWVGVPAGVPDERLIGGLDVGATLSNGAPVVERGLMAAANGGVLRVAMAERLPAALAGPMAAAMDEGLVRIERAGLSAELPARFGLLLMDEGSADDDAPPAILRDRIAFDVMLDGVALAESDWQGVSAGQIRNARRNAPSVHVPDELLRSLDAAALSLGVVSLRAVGFAVKAVRALAALEGRETASEDDAALAAQLCFAHRTDPSLVLPPEEETAELPPPPDPGEADDEARTPPEPEAAEPLEDQLISAVRLAVDWRVQARATRRRGPVVSSGGAGRAGEERLSLSKGRPLAARPGSPRGDARLDLIATLRTAAPWQKLRNPEGLAGRIRLMPEDFRLKRFRQRAESTVIFIVDASGSAAMARMAEAKGAVEHLLAGCYARRDHVALIAFQRASARLLLPPTRSLARVKRELAALPGGGGTPLASGLAAALRLADAEARRGRTPFLVVLSDGRGNVALDGVARREASEEEAVAIAGRIRAAELPVMLFDTGRRAGARAEALAEALGAAYRPLPAAGAEAVAGAVKRFVGR